MNRRLIPALMALALPVTGGLVAASSASAAPARAASDTPKSCLATVEDVDGHPGNEVKALELNEKTDDMIIKLGGVRFPGSGTVSFTSAGQGKSASAFGNPKLAFTGETKMKVVEVDTLFNDDMGATDIPCAPLHSTLLFDDGSKGAYTVELDVEVL